MRAYDRIVKFVKGAMENSFGDPIHYPQGTFLIPGVTALFFFWMTVNAVLTAASTRYIIKPFALLLVALVFSAFGICFFWAGEMSYRWRMALRGRQLRLYRLGQVWRVFIGIVFVAAVVYSYANPVAMPSSPATGPLPAWIFYLIFLSVGAIVSIGTSAVVHAGMAVVRRIGGGRQGGTATRDSDNRSTVRFRASHGADLRFHALGRWSGDL